MTLNQFVSRALSVPFVDKGRSWDGWDCYGVVYAAYMMVWGVHLPEYLEYDNTRDYAQLKQLIEAGRGQWEKLPFAERPRAGDVAVFTISGGACHVALMTDARHALHAEEKLGTFIEPINSPVWAKRMEGIYRLCQTR